MVRPSEKIVQVTISGRVQGVGYPLLDGKGSRRARHSRLGAKPVER